MSYELYITEKNCAYECAALTFWLTLYTEYDVGESDMTVSNRKYMGIAMIEGNMSTAGPYIHMIMQMLYIYRPGPAVIWNRLREALINNWEGQSRWIENNATLDGDLYIPFFVTHASMTKRSQYYRICFSQKAYI
jgi:hypothetical protein